MYLFRPRSHTAEEPNGAPGPLGLNAPGAPPFDDVLPPLNTAALQPGSAAEWAIGELLIRLCNRGRALRPEPPKAPPLE
jgi:hypothetical protein